MRKSFRTACAFSLAGSLVVPGCAAPSTQALNPSGAKVPGATSFREPQHAATYRLLHSFKAGSDGYSPAASLIDDGGTLYGTTENGGGDLEDGTVFRLSPNGKEQVVYRFEYSVSSPPYDYDGSDPMAALISVDGTLYGTTSSGGSYSDGTVFSFKTKERVVYNFGSQTYDGTDPVASLLYLDGTLYGTTFSGGKHGRGTVFALNRDGKERVLYSFASHKNDGLEPEAGLIDVGGKLFGTTAYGGGTCGCGTVFSVSTAGKEQVVYSFGSHPKDGSMPVAGLVDVDGTLYGTTQFGGTANAGAVFSVTPQGKERVLHSFSGRDDGANPVADLVYAGNAFYGTTAFGGKKNWGTIFSITSDGDERVLHSFDGTQGAIPMAGLIVVDSKLYGTTANGGESSKCVLGSGSRTLYGCGTAFELTP